ncbi:MAG: cytochrome c family protein, partial [Gammaproteobacteria bacterium]|nr:cytochrome c family protein [Gammaproteobacteria bacterium]
DPHSTAYDVLSNDVSRAIARRLGLESARTADICLDCHTDNVPADKRGERFQVSDGIGCESCHGGAGNWVSTHYNVPAVSHSDSVAAGLYPTENVADRAALCLSCHLGTRDKFATHRIMAAGHPRLSFELDTFTELWRTAGRQPHYRVDADYRERKTSASHTQTWAGGLLAEGRQRLALIRDRQFAGTGMFPELGLYDCHACHRTMKTVQWRPLPRHGGAGPGVPFLNDGSFVMILALAKAVAPNDATQVEDALKELHRAGSASVESMQNAAQDFDRVLAGMQSRLSGASLRNRERAILDEILSFGAEGNFLDYVSAEQAFMAVQMLAFELGDTDLQAELDQLADSLEDDERYRPTQFARLLRSSAGIN